MNEPKPETNALENDPVDPGNDDLRDRCMMYLLGEMSPQEREHFELQLGDPRITEALLQESELISKLSSSLEDCPALPFSEERFEGHHQTAPKKLASLPAMALLAIAVTTLLFVGLSALSSSNDENASIAQVNPSTVIQVTPELDLNVAQRWAEASAQWEFASNGDEFTEENVADEVSPIDEESDESWDWMLTAYEVTSVEESANDG